jgi:hypothetical protein
MQAPGVAAEYAPAKPLGFAKKPAERGSATRSNVHQPAVTTFSPTPKNFKPQSKTETQKSKIT